MSTMLLIFLHSRERYEDLIRECQTMHSTVGTGALAYVIGSRVMDARTLPRDNNVMSKKETTHNRLESDNRDEKEGHSRMDNIHTNSYLNHRESSSDSAYHDPSNNARSSDVCNCFHGKNEMEVEESYFSSENLFDFQSIPFTNLFEKITPDERRCNLHSHRSSSEHTHRESLNTFQINNNIDLQENWNYRNEGDNIPRKISDVQEETATSNTYISNGLNAGDSSVSEWLWTLHKIGKL